MNTIVRHRLRLGTTAVLLALTGIADIPAWAQQPAPVVVATVRQAPLERMLRLTGTVTSERLAALSPRVSGLVSRMRVDAGDQVKTGAVLLELDATIAQLALARASAGLEEARAQLEEAQRLYEEAERLVERGFLPETRLHAAAAERRVAAATVERLAAERRQQAELVARHRVIAPFDGVVGRRLADAGEWVETGTPVLELVDTRRLRVDVQVPQERFHDVSVGSEARVELDALSGRVLEGKVQARVPVNDPGARTFLARIVVGDGDRLMTPGMSARVVLTLKSGEPALSVPRDAILRRPDGSTSVWVLNEGETLTVSERRVELVPSLQDAIEVRSGVSAGEKIVVRGNETLRDGQRVRIVGSGPAEGS
ncbi:MAG: efflux RND transporter periplasmic adaptor subunit [Burkholderiales bacterium]